MRFPDSQESAERSNRYKVRQIVQLSQIPPNSKEIQLWVSIPRDEQNQRLLSFEVIDCPSKWELIEDLIGVALSYIRESLSQKVIRLKLQ